MHPRQLAGGAEETRGRSARGCERVGDHPVERVRHQQRQEQIGGDLAHEVVEVPARDPLRNSHQWVDHLYLGEVQPGRYLPERRDAPGAVHHDVMPQRRIQPVVVILDHVRGIQLVAVLAVDHPPPAAGLDRGEIVVGELVHEPSIAQRLLDLRVPERLRVVVSRQVDDALPRSLPEARERGEEALVLRAIDRQRGPVLPLRHLPYLQEIEEVAGQDQLHRPLVPRQFLKERRELPRRLETVAARIPPYVGVRDEDHERVAVEF